MSRPFTIPRRQWTGFKGYVADPLNCPEDYLSSPSVNCMVDETGKVSQRLGYLVEDDIDLGEANEPATCFYLEQYDITVFALGTKVKYYDWNTLTVYDTGITLTDGTRTRFDAYTGDVYLTNTTDGLRRLVFGRLNDAAANAGDANVTVDTDMAARLSRFSITSGSLRIQGTAEAFSAVTVSTGVLTHSTTLSKSYSDNAVCLVVSDISSGREKGSKVFFWKERMGIIGSVLATNADQPNATVFFGKFADPDVLESIIDFTFGAGGSTMEMVGKWGRVTNAVPAKDFLYAFKEGESYSASAADVGISNPSASSPGPALGETPFDLKDEVHGCLNEDTACVVGNNEIEYVSSDGRIMRILISTATGAAVVFPDDSFDIPMRDILKNLDKDQTGAVSVYWKGGRKSIHQVRSLGQWYWLVRDQSINAGKGGWQPPQQVLFAHCFFERKGVLYCTDGSDDTVYSLFTSFDDAGVPVDCTIATGNFSVGNSMIEYVEAQGEISQPSVIRMLCYVTNNNAGRRHGSEKKVLGSSYAYSDDHSVGAIAVGEGGVEAETITVAEWGRGFDVFPSEANRVQLVINQHDGGYCSLSNYNITGSSDSTFSSAL